MGRVGAHGDDATASGVKAPEVGAVAEPVDTTRPARVDPERIVAAIQEHRVTYSFGSPALWRTVSEHCVRNNICLTSLTRVLMAGAPVPGYLHARMLAGIHERDGIPWKIPGRYIRLNSQWKDFYL